MKRVFCKFCGKYVTRISYLVELSDLAMKSLNETYRQEYIDGDVINSKALGCKIVVEKDNIRFTNEILNETIANYSMSQIQPRIEEWFNRFSVTSDPEVLKEDSCAAKMFSITQSDPADDRNTSACIDGNYLQYDENHYASLLSCGECHMRLETHRVRKVKKNNMTYYESEIAADKNINIMFLGPPSSGKTILLLAVLEKLIKDNPNANVPFRQLNDRYVAYYYDEYLRKNLFQDGELPKTTGIMQPPVTLELKDYKVTFIDTMGELVSGKKLDALGILNFSDAIVIINPLCTENENQQNNDTEEIHIDIDKTREHLIKTDSFISMLIGAVMTQPRKPTMLLFNKCDLFLPIAREIMLDSSQKNIQNPQQLQLLRKFFFSVNSEVVLTRICQALTDNSSDFFRLHGVLKKLYTNCGNLSNNGVRIQCISPIGSPDPKKLYEINPETGKPLKKQYYISDFIQMIIELCEEISNDRENV